MTQNYLRTPHLVGDTVVFIADDDVWSVPVSGGAATRLTSDRAPASRPRLSPDGTQVAWASRRDGMPEVYVTPVQGGSPLRLTHWGAATTRVLGWDAEHRVVAASATSQPFRTRCWAYALPTDGAPGQRLPYGPIGGLARSVSGAVAVQSVVLREPAAWKRYRGGTAAKLWLDPTGNGTFTRLLSELNGQLADPVWIGERLLFVSDHEGHGNVYSALADGSDLQRHTDHTGAYARDLAGDLSGGSTSAIYARSGELWLVKDLAASAEPTRLEVDLPDLAAHVSAAQ